MKPILLGPVVLLMTVAVLWLLPPSPDEWQERNKPANNPLARTSTTSRGEATHPSPATAPRTAIVPFDSAYQLGRPGAVPVATRAAELLDSAPPPIPISADFLARILSDSGESITVALPGGRTATGTVDLQRHGEDSQLLVLQGHLSTPEPGFYHFARQTESGAGRPG